MIISYMKKYLDLNAIVEELIDNILNMFMIIEQRDNHITKKFIKDYDIIEVPQKYLKDIIFLDNYKLYIKNEYDTIYKKDGILKDDKITNGECVIGITNKGCYFWTIYNKIMDWFEYIFNYYKNEIEKYYSIPNNAIFYNYYKNNIELTDNITEENILYFPYKYGKFDFNHYRVMHINIFSNNKIKNPKEICSW